MAKRKSRWSPEKIEAMRKELLEEDKTLQQLAEREAVTKQFIHQLVGPLRRGYSRLKSKQQQAVNLHKGGNSAADIAKAIGVTRLDTVRQYLREAGVDLPNGNIRHSVEHTIWCARTWKIRYGYTPAPLDWSPSDAERLGYPKRAERFRAFQEEFGCPTVKPVVRLFGSWSEMIRRARLKPAPKGPQRELVGERSLRRRNREPPSSFKAAPAF